MKSLTIRTKLISIILTTIFIVASTVLVDSIITIQGISDKNVMSFTKNAYESKKRTLESYVLMGKMNLDLVYEEYTSNKLNLEETKKVALKTIEKIKFGEDGYFWINDLSGTMLMHPYSKKLNGTNVLDIKDIHGKYIFQEIIEQVKNNDSALIEYTWSKPGSDKQHQKYTYCDTFKPFKWVICTGSYLDDVEESVAQMNETTKNDEKDVILYGSLKIILISTLIACIVLYINNRTIINPIKRLSDTVRALTKFTSADQAINLDSEDELGKLAHTFNEYLGSNRETAVSDQKIVEESEKAIQMVRAGFFTYKIKATSDNRSANDLKNSINDLIDDMNEKLTEINHALIEYSNNNFSHDFNIKGVSGTIGSIVIGTKNIADNVSELLATILQSGENLDNTINILTDSASSLSKSANEQAVSLEETAAAVEEIASNIKSSSENITKMKDIEEKVLVAASHGESLARETVDSMNKINEEVTSINEAISVIDQIAFQTNILSLNAAVEAATAGEAGKGFAVVAQEVRNLATRSAEAAKQIQDLVSQAKIRANAGKDIADKMIVGYTELQTAIGDTKLIIDDVSSASKEQEIGISQINDAVAILDQNTQENASDANNIASLANDVKQLSNNLITVAHNAEFKEKARKQIHDQELTHQLNKLKMQHVIFKEKAFASIANGVAHEIKNSHQCDLGLWMQQCELENKQFTRTNIWSQLKVSHNKVHDSVLKFMKENEGDVTNETLIGIGNEIESATEDVFALLDQIKIENAKEGV